jgi:hypothetical protein
MASHQKVDLVASDYYEKELKFQDKIDGLKNTNALADKFAAELNAESIVLHYPAALNGKKLIGEILLYRPSDANMDQKFSVLRNDKGTQVLPLKKTKRGYYKLQCTLEVEGKKYYYEEPVQIN